jgi:hypothetical protein
MRDRHAPLSHRSGFPILQRPDAAILPALPEVRRRCFREGAPLPKISPSFRAPTHGDPRHPVAPCSRSRFRLNVDNDRCAGVAVFLLDDEEIPDTSGVSVLLLEQL